MCLGAKHLLLSSVSAVPLPALSAAHLLIAFQGITVHI